MDNKLKAFFNNRADIYEKEHLSHIKGGIASKKMIADYIPDRPGKMLDLGAGTGLELEFVFQKNADWEIDCVDIADKMLDKLAAKFCDKKINIFANDYFEFQYNKNYYDCIISVMSLHHFSKEDKEKLYGFIFSALKTGGVFINSDYTAKSIEEEKKFLEEFKAQTNLDEEFHFDTPTHINTDIRILTSAGFKEIKVPWEIESNALIVCKKI